MPPLPEEEKGGEGPTATGRFPARVSSRISGWKAVDYAQYTALAVTQVSIGLGLKVILLLLTTSA